MRILKFGCAQLYVCLKMRKKNAISVYELKKLWYNLFIIQ